MASRPGTASAPSQALLYLAAGASGCLWGLCFSTQTFELLPWIGFAPLFLFVRRKDGWRLGFVHGLATWLVAIPWIAETVEVYGGLSRWLSWLALLSVASYLAIYHLAFALLARRFIDSPARVALIVLPSGWAALEQLRTAIPVAGFPWNLAAYSAIEVPGALELGAWIGPYGVGALVVFVNLALYLGISQKRLSAAASGIALPVVLLWCANLWAIPASDLGAEGLEVRIIQPNTPILTDAQSPAVAEEYRKLFRLSNDACQGPGTMLIWPESAAWPYTFERDAAFREAVEQLAQRGCPVLLNSPRRQGDDVFNSAFLVTSSLETQSYDKRHLVPFGEYVPLGGLVPFIDSLARNAGNFSSSDTATLFAIEETELGLSICFEVTFAAEVADLVRSGATVLATITNDAWYGDTSAPHQHLRAARFRAAENGRPMLRAALTGISAVIAPDGSVTDLLGVGEEGVLAAHVNPSNARTLYTRAPWLASTAASLVVLFAILWRPMTESQKLEKLTKKLDVLRGFL